MKHKVRPIRKPAAPKRPAAPRRRRPAFDAEAVLARGRTVLEAEAAAIRSLAPRLGAPFVDAVRRILSCRGRVVVTGMGKAGFVAQKLSATLASSGTPSLYLHPAEALHGDLGRVVSGDVVVALSNSGRTEEVLRLLGPVKRIGALVIALTGDASSPLARGADLVLELGPIEEACPLGLVPTASAAALLALSDALAMAILAQRPFGSEDYALFHPSGSLGRSVTPVEEVMRQGRRNPVVREDAPLAEAVRVMTQTPGRPGATSVVDATGVLVGVFTDGDLRRLLEEGRFSLTIAVGEVMCRAPRTVRPTTLVQDATRILREKTIDQLPVVDDAGRPVGLLDVQDVLALA